MFFKKDKNKLEKSPLTLNLQKKKRIYIAFSICTFIIAALVLIHWTKKFENEKKWIDIIVANREINEIKTLEEIDLQIKAYPKTLINDEVFIKKEDLIGLTLSRSMPKGAIIYKRDVLKEIGPDSISLSLKKDKKAFSIDDDWLAAKTLAKAKDRVDIIIANKKTDLGENDFIIRNAEIINVTDISGGTKSITLALSDAEIRLLMYAKVNEFAIQFAILPI
jgi:Flp pilus assembly protein CpaB